MPKIGASQDNVVLCGDCREIIPTLGKFDFIFADPPFNIGQHYLEYNDRKPLRVYAEFTCEWVPRAWEALTEQGVLALHGPDSLADIYILLSRADSEMDGKRIAWINWHYRFGQCNRSNWIDARCHCLVYARDPKSYTWNPKAVLVESDRATRYKDKRIDDYENGGRRLPGTVWGVPSDGPNWGRIQGDNKERVRECPNQLPEVYLERLIRAYTNPGDRILDPFGGSGTTAVVAKALGRRYVTIDVSEKNCELIRQRLKRGAVRV